jgi:hypothetical protein
MDNNNTGSPTDSAVRQQFLQPLQAAYVLTATRKCPSESDWDWLVKGVERVLNNGRSGRDFLQTFQMFWPQPMGVGAYFDNLSSPRRLTMTGDCGEQLRRQVDRVRTSPLAAFPELDDFDLYAGDGHYLEAATHDAVPGETAWATGHFFVLNMKSQSLAPLALADQTTRKKEHDMRMLKRQSVARLRQGAGKGRKVLWAWDRGGIDLPFWLERKQSGIYFLSLRKTCQCLAVEKIRPVAALPINQGVVSDLDVSNRDGLVVREITYLNPCDGQVYVYLTTERTLEPGLLALLYKTRWEIEKVFDETKTKLQEQKAWATSATAKAMQAQFMAITHNLLLLLQDQHEKLGVENTAELQRKQKRLAQQEQALVSQKKTLPPLYKSIQRFTQATFKLIRWLRTHWHQPTSLAQALHQLRGFYAKL